MVEPLGQIVARYRRADLSPAKIIHADRARAAQLGRDRHLRNFSERRDAMTALLRTADLAAHLPALDKK